MNKLSILAAAAALALLTGCSLSGATALEDATDRCAVGDQAACARIAGLQGACCTIAYRNVVFALRV